MDCCKNCEIWKIPRGFQRPSDYASTSEKLAVALEQSELILISESSFIGKGASTVKWPKNSVSGHFKCPKCGQQFRLIVDVDACRGGFSTDGI